jgi:DnaK suppressor protein
MAKAADRKRHEPTGHRTQRSSGGDKGAEGSSRSSHFLGRQRDHLVELRASNEAQAAESRADLADLAERDGPDEVQFDDESGEGGNKLVDMDRERTVAGLAQVTIDDIDWALAKIDQGSYGRCEHCGRDLPRARLEALPAARLCVDCKGSPRGGGLSCLRKRTANRR